MWLFLFNLSFLICSSYEICSWWVSKLQGESITSLLNDIQKRQLDHVSEKMQASKYQCNKKKYISSCNTYIGDWSNSLSFASRESDIKGNFINQTEQNSFLCDTMIYSLSFLSTENNISNNSITSLLNGIQSLLSYLTSCLKYLYCHPSRSALLLDTTKIFSKPITMSSSKFFLPGQKTQNHRQYDGDIVSIL